MTNPLRIGITGPLCDNDLVMAEYLRRIGLDCVVFRFSQERKPQLTPLFYRHLKPYDIEYCSGPFDLLSKIRSVDYVFSFSAVLPMWLGKYRLLYPILKRFGWPRFATVGTGSSLTEAIVGEGLHPRLARLAQRMADINIVNNYPHAVKNLIRFGICNVVFLPLMLMQPDLRSFVAGNPEKPRQPGNNEVIFFHPGHLDWAQTDNAPGRNSTKGNDRFLRAFARLVLEKSAKARLVILDRGPDRGLARQLIQDLGIEKFVTWRNELSREDYLKAVLEADVIVDQFDVGAFGGIAWEAMCLGKPVIVYVDKECHNLAYWDEAPVLSAHTEEEVLEQLIGSLDQKNLANQTAKVSDFVSRYNWRSLIEKYVVYAEIGARKRAHRYGLDFESPNGQS